MAKAVKTRAEHLRMDVQWRERLESLDECAARAAGFFRDMRAFDKALGWLGPMGKSARTEPRGLEYLSEGWLRRVLKVSRARRGAGLRPKEEVPFIVFFTGPPGALGPLWGHFVSGSGHIVGAPLPNLCLLQFSRVRTPEECGRMLTAEYLSGLMEIAVRHWEPDMGSASSYETDLAAFPHRRDCTGPRPGWLTYVADHWGRVPELPAPYRVRRLEGRGSLIVVDGIDMLTASNPEHVRTVRRLWELLRDAGLVLFHSPDDRAPPPKGPLN